MATRSRSSIPPAWISAHPTHHSRLRQRLVDAGVEIAFEHGNSFYFSGPDGERLELLADDLGQMGDAAVL